MLVDTDILCYLLQVYDLSEIRIFMYCIHHILNYMSINYNICSVYMNNTVLVLIRSAVSSFCSSSIFATNPNK